MESSYVVPKTTGTVVAVLSVLVLAGVPRIGSQCVETRVAEVHDTGFFGCSTPIMRHVPRWKINEQMYLVSHLPPEITHNGWHNISISTAGCEMKVTCFFRLSFESKIFNIYSNTVEPVSATSCDDLPFCNEENLIFEYHGEFFTVYMGSQSYGENCTVSVTISDCQSNQTVCIMYPVKENNTMIELDSMNMLYGKNVAVTFDNDCDHCEENHFYLPDIKLTVKFVSSNMSGTIIEDLSNDYCDFNSLIINYRICINSGGTNQCFENPCGNGEIYTSRCGSDPPQRVVSLETNGVENGAIISIFCFGIDCKGNPTNVMVFNIKIAICEEGSMCIEENQTGNTTNMPGTSSTPPQPPHETPTAMSSPGTTQSPAGLVVGVVGGSVMIRVVLVHIVIGIIIFLLKIKRANVAGAGSSSSSRQRAALGGGGGGRGKSMK